MEEEVGGVQEIRDGLDLGSRLVWIKMVGNLLWITSIRQWLEETSWKRKMEGKV